MKITTIFSTMLLSLFILSCSTNSIDVEDLSRFHKLYIVQAGEGHPGHTLDITDSIQTIALSVGLGGISEANTDILITLDADPDLVYQFNEENQTDYLVMPSGSYEIVDKNVTLKKGAPYSTLFSIALQTKDYIEPGRSYLLPVSITGSDITIPINDELKTAFIKITGTYPLGEEPPAKVWELRGRTFIYLLVVQGALAGSEMNLLDIYEYDHLAGAFKYDPVPGLPTGGFGVFDIVIASPTGLIARDVNGVYSGVPGSLFEYSIDVEGRTLSGIGITGNGFNAYDLLTFSANHNAIFGRMTDGSLELIRKVDGMWNGKITVGSGYDKYTIIEAYQDGLLAMESSGDLWYINIADDGQADEPRQVGSGWNKYSKLMANGDHLLALDFSGIVWQYEFDLRGTWNVGQ